MVIDRRAPLSFTYRGHDAEHNAIDMRLFGHSLIGMERLLTDGLILIHEGREPRMREKAPVSLVVQAPYAGSVGVLGGIVPALGQLPLLWNYVTSGGAKATMEFVAYVLNLRGGRPAEAEAHKDAMIEQLKIMEAARDRADTRTHDTIRHIIDSFVGNNASRVSRAARQAVAPLGRTVDTLGIGEEEGVNGQIDAPMAEVIRENSGAIVGDQERFVVQVDGYQHHNRVLKIVRPDGEGYIAAIVTDPTFDHAPNIYTEAAAMRAGLVVDAKKTFRDGRIERIHISNAVEIIRLT